MRKLLVTVTILGVVALSVTGIALAADPHSIANGNPTGQPSQSCGSATALSNPGGLVTQSNPGAPFLNSNGVSGGVYANGPGTGGPGTATGTGHITNSNAVSQYDVACYQVSQTHP
jgi:hypothetical protein